MSAAAPHATLQLGEVDSAAKWRPTVSLNGAAVPVHVAQARLHAGNAAAAGLNVGTVLQNMSSCYRVYVCVCVCVCFLYFALITDTRLRS